MDWISTHIPPWVFIALVMFTVVMGTVAYLILLERKIASWTQDRVGPNRVGFDFGILPFKFHFWGLGQPMADGLKFLFKEDYRARNVDKVLFSLAPCIMILVMIVAMATVPWGGAKGEREAVSIPPGAIPAEVVAAALPKFHSVLNVTGLPAGAAMDAPLVAGGSVLVTHGWRLQIASLNVGVLFILAVLSLAVYGVVLGGWASNNKYSFLGGLRATASMVSYEIPLGLSVLAIVTLYGTLDLGTIVDRQAGYWLGVIPAWNVFTQPVLFLLFLTCLHAEANRAPFDIAEAEQELVGGYHTEYSSMRFALFFLSEYAGMIVTSAVCTALFFGGWHLPYIDKLWPALTGAVDPAVPSVTRSWVVLLVGAAVFYGKTAAILATFMWVRWSLPRFRFDQILLLSWRGMIPMSLGLLVATAVVVFALSPRDQGTPAVTPVMAAALLAANGVVVAVALAVSRLVPHSGEPNRRRALRGSRFTTTPLPAWVGKGTP